LLCATFSLYAQSTENTSIFFSPITGAGYSPGDNRVINRMIANELATRKYTLLSTPEGANFFLYGSLSFFYEDADYEDLYVARIRPTTVYNFNAPIQEYYDELFIFQLILKNVKTNEIILQNVIYHSLDDVYNFFPLVANNLFKHMAGKGSKQVASGDWLNKYLYLGLNAFWSPRIYYGREQSAHFENFGGGASIEWSLLKVLSLEAGAQLIPDWIVYSPNGEYFRNLMLEIPLILRLSLKLSDHYMLGPYGGIQLNIPFYDTTKPPPVAWMVGIMGGVRAGPGIFYVEPRYAMDIGNSSIIPESNAAPFEYQRYIVHIGVGYKFGFFTKKK